MKEAYCSYEVSKLLKEKGFAEPSFAYYSAFDNWKILRFWRRFPRATRNELYLTAPTHQMACDWVETTYDFFIEIGRSIDLNGKHHYFYRVINRECKCVYPLTRDRDYLSKYDAVDAALTCVLENLI